MQRLIIQMAQASDAQADAQRAAERAVKRALSQTDIPAPDALGIAPEEVLVRLNIGVPASEDIDAQSLLALNRLGRTEVRMVPGGLRVTDEETGAVQVVVTVGAEIFLPKQTGWRLTS